MRNGVAAHSNQDMVTSVVETRLALQGRVISNFALIHFLGAKRFAARVSALEREHAGEALGSFFEEIAVYTSGCVIAAAAAVEALINELYLTESSPLHQAIDNFDAFFWGSSPPWWCFFKSKRAAGLEMKPALDKYRRALVLLGKPAIPRNQQVREDIALLLGLRNCLIHFKPLWDEDRRHAELELGLAGRFHLSPFIDTSTDFIAKQCMSAGCAQWAVDSVATFVREFQRKSGLMPDKLSQFC